MKGLRSGGGACVAAMLASIAMSSGSAFAQSAGPTVSIGNAGEPAGQATPSDGATTAHADGTIVTIEGAGGRRAFDAGCTVRATTYFDNIVYVACDGGVVRTFRVEGGTFVAQSEHRVGAQLRGFFVANNRVWLEYARIEAQPVDMLPYAGSAGTAAGPAPSSVGASAPARTPVVDTEPTAPHGRVIEVRGNIVTVSMGRNRGAANGMRVEIGVAGDDPSANSTVVGNVRAVGATRAEVEVGFGERVAVGDRARVTNREPTGSMVAPIRSGSYISVGGGVRVLIPISNLGIGLLTDLNAEWHASVPFALRARLFPVGFLYVGNSSYGGSSGANGLFGGSIEAMFDSRFFAIGLGLGVSPYSGYSYYGSSYSQYGFSIASSIRVGALDGLHLALQMPIIVANNAFQFGGMDGQIQIPLARTWWLMVRGGFLVAPLGYTDVGMRIAVRGNGGAGTLFVTPTLGWAGMNIDYGFRAGPTAGIGVEYRIGL